MTATDAPTDAPTMAPTTIATTTDAPAAVLSLADAAANAQLAIDAVDDLDACPFGPVASIMAVMPAPLDLVPGFAATGADVDGQVFSGGDADITYCNLVPNDHSKGTVDSIRTDVAPGTLPLAAYLDEEFGAEEAVPPDPPPEQLCG